VEIVSGKRQGRSYSYDGLAFDNVNLGRRRWSALSRQYPNWKYAGKLQQWNNGFLTFLKKIRKELNKHGFKLVANHSMYYGTDTDKAFSTKQLSKKDKRKYFLKHFGLTKG